MTKWTAPDIASIRGDNSRPLQKIFGSLTEYLKDYQNTIETGSAQSSQTFVRNGEATTLTIGTVVYLDAQQGDRATVKRAFNTSDATSAKTLGVVAETIPANADGLVTTLGYLEKVNTSAFTAGQTLYLGSTAGTFTATKPHAPNHMVYVGVVVRANAGNGIIYVRCQNGYELDEIHDVLITSPTTGDILMRNGSSLWVNTPQTSITSVGTLTAGNVPASLLSGTTLPASIVSSSLTTVGTLSALRVDGNFGIGANGLAQMGLRIGKAISGSAFAQGIYLNGEIQPSVTSRADMVWTTPTVAASVTIPTVNQFYATLAGVGAGSTVTVSAGFVAESNLGNPYSGTITSAYSFMGNLNTLAGFTRYNLFMNGSAPNFLNGRLGVGVALTSGAMAQITNPNASASDKVLVVKGAASQAGDFFDIQDSSGASQFKVDSVGNVGIGTTTPTSKLKVDGSATIDSQANVAAQFGTSGGTNNLLVGSVTGNTPFVGSQGASALTFRTNAVERIRITSDGNVGIGTTSLTSTSFRVGKIITGAINSYASIFQGTVQADVTSQAYGVYASLSTTGTPATAPTLTLFAATQGTLAGTVTSNTQRGYFADSNLIGATNNYAFQGAIPSGTGRYNLYMSGTADNYLAGRLGVGATLTSGATTQISNPNASPADKVLVVKGAALQSGDFLDIQNSAGTSQFKVNSAGEVGIASSPISNIRLTITGGSTNSANPIVLLNGVAGSGALYFHNDMAGGAYNAIVTAGAKGIIATGANSTTTRGALVIAPWSSDVYGIRFTGGSTTDILVRGTTTFTPSLAANKALIIKGVDSQSASLFEAQNSSGTALVTINSAGKVGIGNTAPENTLDITGSFGRGNPAVKTANFTLAGTENWIICNGAGTINITLPTPSDCDGREFGIKTVSPQLVQSAANNVIAIGGGLAGAAILPATSGAWAILVSDGANWNIMCRGT